jgi:mono/diheme cytochrome c family protein
MRGFACWLAVFAAAPVAGRAADARAGEALYVGAARLANGGAPCLACHGLAGHGLAWRASFGPDLTDVGVSYDADTIAGLLADVPFPTMAPLYAAHAITAAEREDLAAFLLAARGAAGATDDPRGRLLLEAGAGALALLAILAALARRRMPPVADALRRQRAARHALRGQP